jgi:hypothetical protein
MNGEASESFEGWTIWEIMGHRRLGGYVREVELAGAGFLRIDIPGDGDGSYATQYYPPASVYGLTPCSEAAARAVALRNRPEPVQRWELPEAAMVREEQLRDDDDNPDDDDRSF